MKCVQLENPDSRQILLFFRQSLHNIREYIFIYKKNSTEYDIAVKLSLVAKKHDGCNIYKYVYSHFVFIDVKIFQKWIEQQFIRINIDRRLSFPNRA